jgi:tRNA(Ile)-lysidine synthase
MRMKLATAVLQAIERARPPLLSPGDRVGLAVSGGADSVAMLHLLGELRERLGLTLLVLHVDHALRPDAAGDARFVKQLAESRGLAFFGQRIDVAAAAAKKKWNLEDAGRRLRYEFFARIVRENRADKIAVAHTMDDQAETVLARLIRGTGPAGLAGIHPLADRIVRPLLGFRRAALREYLGARGQSWREDSTNLDTTRQRAKIRHELLPPLERDFSAAIVPHLSELARLSHEEDAFWSALVEDRFAQLVEHRRDRSVISVDALLRPLALRAEGAANQPSRENSANPLRTLTERLLRRLYQEARRASGELSAVHVEQLIHLADQSQSGRRIELPGGVIAERNFGEIAFYAGGHRARVREAHGARRTGAQETSPNARAYQYVVILRRDETANVAVPELGTCFRLKVIDWSSAERETINRDSFLDLDRLPQPLFLRSWRSGDSYRPRGRRNRRKLKDMFVASRIAVGDRALWPVLESRGQVVWARGMAPAQEVCAGKETRTGVLIEERKLEVT